MWLVVLLWVGLSSSALVAPAWAETSLFPDAAPPGATVTISGKGFGQFQSAEQNRVFFNNVPALIQRWETDFIEAKVPHQASTGPVSVVTGTNKRVPAGTFTIVMPQIQSLGPEEIVRGKVLQITGRHFGNTAGSKDPNTMFGVNEVRIGGVKAKVRKWRDDKIEVVVPATAKSGDVVVRLASSDPLPNGYCCAPVAYSVSNAVTVTILPTIRVEPLHGPVGTKVVLFGAGFGSQAVAGELVLLNGDPMTIAEWKNESIVVHVPLNATSGPLLLRQGGRERQLGSFTVDALKVTALSPTGGPIGSLLRIRGEHFGNYTESGAARFSFLDFDPGDNKVTIGGVPAIVYRWNDDLIDVWVPFSAKGGRVVVQRGGTIPKADGSCCADRGVVSVEAGSFSLLTPTVESVTPMAAGIDEVITIKGVGFGSRLKTREATDPALGKNAFLSKPIRLSENISRTEVLFNGVAAVVVSWTDSEIQVQVPRRLLYGIGSTAEFLPDLSKGPLVIRRGSWDLLPDGTCCSEKKWLSVDAGEFTIMAKGLPDQGFFNDPNQSYP